MTAEEICAIKGAMQDDSSILALAASQGDAPSISSLYERHLPAFRAYIRLRMGPLLRRKESESDIVQSVFQDVVADLGVFQWKGEAAFKHFLYEKGRRKIIDHVRHFQAKRRDAAREMEKREGLPSVADCHERLGTASQFAIGKEKVNELEHAFDALPEDYAEVIVNIRLLGLSSEEAAERMDRSVGAIHVLLSRALARLSTVLQDLKSEG